MSVTTSPPPIPSDAGPTEDKYGGFTRFDIELEFVQCLANPQYLNHLAAQKLLDNPDFVAYLQYLKYWSRPPYLKYLTYPGPTLRYLELLQQETFRKDVLTPGFVNTLLEDGMKSAVVWHKDDS